MNIPAVILLIGLLVPGSVFAQAPLGEAVRRRGAAVQKSLERTNLPTPTEQNASEKLFSEAHWHGIELIALSKQLARKYGIPMGTRGLLVDETTLEAAEAGFLAGDVVQAVEGVSTTTFEEFLKATINVQNRREARVSIWRSARLISGTGAAGSLRGPPTGRSMTLTLRAAKYYDNLGYANMGAAPPIPPNAISPHGTRDRACTDCHILMETNGQLGMDAGDLLAEPPPIFMGARPSHGERGACYYCHKIITARPPPRPTWPVPARDPRVAQTVPTAPIAQPGQSPSQWGGAAPVPVRPAAGMNDAELPGFSPQDLPADFPGAIGAAAHEVPPAGFEHKGVPGHRPIGDHVWMGMEIEPLTPRLAREADLPQDRGVVVVSVAPNSPAKGVGMRAGDIITKIGGITVSDVDHLSGIIAPLPRGEEIQVTLLRQGDRHTVSFFLGDRPKDLEGLEETHFSFPMLLVVAIFAVVYLLIFVDVFGHLFAFILGAGLALYVGLRFEFYSLGDMARAINYYILMFIVGMNIIAAVLVEAGFVSYVSKRITLFTQGDKWRILLFFALTTYVVSCFMDNIATILILVPITLTLAKDLDFDPKPVLVAQVIASNLGGASTMVGDFPNMLIGLSTDLEFHDFIIYEMPICILLLGAMLLYFRFSKQSELFTKRRQGAKQAALFKRLNSELSSAIKDRKATNRALAVLGLVVLGFLFSGALDVNPAYIAFTGGILLLFISGLSKMKILRTVGISDVLFFTFLFIMVGAAEASGILYMLAQFIITVSGGHALAIAILMMWLAAFMCAFMNAGPTAAVFIPVVVHLGIEPPNHLFWWSLSLGVLAGSSALLTAASGGPLTSSIVHKFWKKHREEFEEKDSAMRDIRNSISFREYARMGVPIMFMFLVLETLYITFLYFL